MKEREAGGGGGRRALMEIGRGGKRTNVDPTRPRSLLPSSRTMLLIWG